MPAKREVFEERGETYKVQIVDEIPEDEEIALYHHQEYIDMCRGLHVPNTRHLKTFKLTKLAGRFPQRNAATYLRHRLGGRQATPGHLPGSVGGGGGGRHEIRL